MHWVKFCVAPWQLFCPCQLLAACWSCATGEALAWGAGAASEEPPPKKPPMALPTEEPIATPLQAVSDHVCGAGCLCRGSSKS